MIYRLTYCNKDGVEARVDIQKGLATPVIEVEGTGRPFILSYNNDKGDKSGMFLSSSADIEIYETTDFNIDNLKTSNETELSVTHYINNVVSWQGFIIPDFFSIEVRNNPVITMTASDRLGTLKNVTLSDLPSMISLRELAILCLNKTGLELPLRTMADFNNGAGTNDFFNSKILTQRLSDTKGRSISCYDILSSILTASNSFLVQRSGGWHIINKIQHEAGSGKLYTGERTFINWSDVIFNFSDISIGGRRTIIPVASTVGVYHEHGGGRLHPDNYDFSKGLTGWSAVGDFTASIDNRQIDGFQTQGGQAGYFPIYGAATENSYLVNYNQYERNVNPKYLESAEITIPYNGSGAIEVEVDVNATGPLTYPGSSFAPATLRISVVAVNGAETLTLDHGGKFIPMPSANPPIFSKDFGKALPVNDVYKADSIGMKVKGTLEVGSLENYKLKVRIYGGTGGRTILVNMVSLSMKNTQEVPKGTIYKTEKGDNFTKAHDIETAIFGDYLTGGVNGYFYDYPIDDTSSLYNSSNELTSKWTAYNDTEQLPLLQHVSRQKSRLFSVAHDLLSAEIEVNNFDPLAIFVACNKRYTVVSAQFDFFKSNLSVELEEVAFQNATVRDFIYSYFGDGESGIKSIGGISGGTGGGGTGGGLTPEQIEILSWWKKDPDNPDTIFTEMNAYSTKELSAYGLGSGSGGGGDGTVVSWGTELDGGIGLTVDGIAKTLALKSGLDLKQDKLIAGSGITIVGNTISSTATGGGTTVSWGTEANGGVDLTVDGISKTLALHSALTDKQDKLIAGSGINIVGNTISSTATGGGITSVGLTAPTGFTVSNSPITSNGNLELSFATGYSLPTTAKQGQWDTAFTNSHTHANKTQLDLITQSNIDVLAKLSIVNGNLQINGNAYATGELSAYGLGSGSGGGGGGIIETVYGYSNLGQTFNNSVLTDTFNAYTINQINTRLVSVENGSALTVNTTGTGNAITSISKAGTVITASKDLTFSLSGHTHPISDITNLQTTLNSKLETSIFNTHNNDNIRHITGAERTKWDGVVTDFDGLEIGGRNLFTASLAPESTGITSSKEFIISGWSTTIQPSTRINEVMKSGQTYTISYDVEIIEKPAGTPDTQAHGEIGFYKSDLGYFRAARITYEQFANSKVGDVFGVKETFVAPANIGDRNMIIYSGYIDGYGRINMKFKNLQLEDGNKKTAFRVAPEDQVSDWLTTDVNSFSFIKNKPTTLSGYGITDAVTLNTVQTITGAKTFNQDIRLGVNISINGTNNNAGVWNVDNLLWIFGSSRVGSVTNIRSEKVGVGTDTPTQKLHVVGNILATGTTTTTKVIFNAAGWSMEQVGNELQMRHNNVLKMRFTSAGSIVATEEITAHG